MAGTQSDVVAPVLDVPPEQIGHRIRRIREFRNLTQKDLVSRTGLAVTTIGDYETAPDSKRRKHAFMQAIADALEVHGDAWREGATTTGRPTGRYLAPKRPASRPPGRRDRHRP